MTPLPLELDRLYGWPAKTGGADLRAAVLEVALPAGWDQLSAVWQGVQADLELPAPAIAVSGVDGMQLWFSVAAATPATARARFLQSLRERYLRDVAAAQVRIFADAATLPAAPPVETGPQRWSAFVTPDLASVFAETPWLDIPPTGDGQATILRALAPMADVAFEAALRRLDATGADRRREPVPAVAQRPEGAETDPARFLATVMNDAAAPLALRIEAARILLDRASSRDGRG